jgi:glycosyltransferase A (GT-A) superfamily protein (DUF2064 family)
MEEYFKKCCLFLYEGINDVEVYHQSKSDSFSIYNKSITESETITLPRASDTAQKMKEAFMKCFNKGYRKVIMINSNLEIDNEIIKHSFLTLKMVDFCIGPTGEGNIYLIGMNSYEPSLFDEIQLNGENHFKQVVKSIGRLKKAIYRLPPIENSTAVLFNR